MSLACDWGEVSSGSEIGEGGMSYQQKATKVQQKHNLQHLAHSRLGRNCAHHRLSSMSIASETRGGIQYADCHFFRLPAELRVEIHQLTLTRDGLRRISFHDQRPRLLRHITQLHDFLVCKKWFSEAYPEYLQQNEFEFNSIEDLKRFVEGHEISRTTIRARINGVKVVALKTETIGPFCVVTGPARGSLFQSGEPEQSWSRSWTC
ncbi:hypothetical protein HII31_05971, partial [Pseudocercospora fuligena]